jgi:alpha-ketoglutarate-dependent taurine dioxygenase
MLAGWQQALTVNGFALLRDVPCLPDNAALIALGQQLGSPSLRALAHRSGLVEADGVQRVEALAKPARDQFGKTLLSSHFAAFPLHTDEAFLPQPARWVLLHCWRADPSGNGMCLLADGSKLLESADAAMAIALPTMLLPYAAGDFPVIDARARVRFNGAECESAAQLRQVALNDRERDMIQRAQGLANRLAFAVSLQRGDVLIVDNWRMLHGRTAFAAGSSRMLKRLRIV